MKTNRRSLLFLCLAITLVFCVQPTFAQDATDKRTKLDDAIAVMRNIDPTSLDADEREAFSKKLHKAWKVLVSAGDRGRERVLLELKRLDERKIEDDFFKLDASKLLWVGWQFDAAETIGAIWQSTPLGFHYDRAFHIAYEAARTKDPRALPMMKSLLGDDQNRAFLPKHVLTLAWPLPLEFIWGVYGTKGRSELLAVLKSSKDPATLKSAVVLLAKARYRKALPTLRKVARNGPGEARLFAIEWLGECGHPDDRAFLVSGLKSGDSQTVIAHLMGLACYDDMSTASAVAELLESGEADIRDQTIRTLMYVLGADAIKALHDHAASTKNASERERCQRIVDRILLAAELDYKGLSALPKAEADERLLLANPIESSLRLKPDDRELTHEELRKACLDWKSRARITGGKFEWIESRHVLSVATAKDLKRLLMVRAAVYRRLSDECLYEIEILNEVLRRVGRMRYRKIPGLCMKVEPKKDAKAE